MQKSKVLLLQLVARYSFRNACFASVEIYAPYHTLLKKQTLAAVETEGEKGRRKCDQNANICRRRAQMHALIEKLLGDAELYKKGVDVPLVQADHSDSFMQRPRTFECSSNGSGWREFLVRSCVQTCQREKAASCYLRALLYPRERRERYDREDPKTVSADNPRLCLEWTRVLPGIACKGIAVNIRRD